VVARGDVRRREGLRVKGEREVREEREVGEERGVIDL
jgi:hypothetical protein